MDEINLLAVASFVGVAVGGVAGFLGYYLRLGRSSDESKKTRELSVAYKECEENYLQILSEREDIMMKISSINRQANYQLSLLTPSVSSYYPQLFQQPPIVDLERERRHSIACQFKELLDSYPDFDSDSLNNVSYLDEFSKRISEHHALTVELADLFFANKTKYLCSSTPKLSTEYRV